MAKSTRTFLLIFLSIAAVKTFAAGELTYFSYFGDYEIQSCKINESTGEDQKLCQYKNLNIGLPLYNQTNFSQMKFSGKGLRDRWEALNVLSSSLTHTTLNKEADGSEHYWERSVFNETKHIYRDFWIRKNPEGTVKLVFKYRETKKDEEATLTSQSAEYVLKKVP